jgi:hypothetical protein
VDELLSCVPCTQTREVSNPCALIEGSNLESIDITRVPAQRAHGSIFSTYVALKSKAAGRFPRLREVHVMDELAQQGQVFEALSQSFEQSQRLVGGIKRLKSTAASIKSMDEVELALMLQDGCAILSPCKSCFGGKSPPGDMRGVAPNTQASAAASGWSAQSAAEEHALAMQKREAEARAYAATQQRELEEDQIRRDRAAEVERTKQQHELQRVQVQAAQAEAMRMQMQAREEMERAARATQVAEQARASFIAE